MKSWASRPGCFDCPCWSAMHIIRPATGGSLKDEESEKEALCPYPP